MILSTESKSEISSHSSLLFQYRLKLFGLLATGLFKLIFFYNPSKPSVVGFSSLCWPLKNYFEYFKENGSPGPNKTLEHAMAMAMVTKSESSKPESEGGAKGQKGGGGRFNF